MSIFSSVKILDLTRVFSGPFATRHFADFGAEVIKIEPPDGDDSRRFPPLVGEWSGYFEVLNRNKSSIVLDLKDEADLTKFYDLCLGSDVLVENFSSNVKKRLKIDYETIRSINPRIIYASVNGISPKVDRKYYDVIAQAESGLISLNGENEDMKISTSIVDAFSGMKLAHAISSALFFREKTGGGICLSVSMKGSAFDLLEQNLIESSLSKKNPVKVGNMDNAIAPFGIFKTKDGAVALAIGNDVMWEKFASWLKITSPTFNSDIFQSNSSRLTNIDILKEVIENAFQHYESSALIATLTDLGVACGKVNTMTDVLADTENYEEGLLEKYSHPIAGEIVIPTGGIFFEGQKREAYIPSPGLNKKVK